MKAWIGTSKYHAGEVIVFANNRRCAKNIIFEDGIFAEDKFADIRVIRFPLADNQYRGSPKMDFNNLEDRKFLVKECGYYCDEIIDSECDKCLTKKWCYLFEK